ncbi:sodium:proton antiporter [Priestia koreensis]|uniref:HoxN/HupN/NixA family nickel/cobalt transporter n=1 Tax=Priestia koreensis TaxID=284581 RepID=UPI0028F721A0|nr:sodium:proton antiporter [Priestia koreensis]
MEQLSLFMFVFVLGLRHGLDADHLACIDGITRYNLDRNHRVAHWVGTCFSFGHGMVVAGVGVVLASFSRHFTFPAYFDGIVTWVSIISLFLIGTLNVYNLLRPTAEKGDFRVQGVKSKLLPRFVRETSNPFLIMLIGGIFALAADTVSQTSIWAVAAGQSNPYMPYLLGATFVIGMMITDTIDSFIVFGMLKQSNAFGKSASRLMGWVIVFLAYGVSMYQLFTYFYPKAEVDFEMVGIAVFAFLMICFGLVWTKGRKAEKVISS